MSKIKFLSACSFTQPCSMAATEERNYPEAEVKNKNKCLAQINVETSAAKYKNALLCRKKWQKSRNI